MCLGDVGSLDLAFAALVFSDSATNDSRFTDKCVGNFDGENLVSFKAEPFGNLSSFQFQVRHVDLCFDTYVIAHLIDRSYYGEHKHRCRKMGGRLPEADEFEAFLNHIEKIGQMEMKNTKNVVPIGTWLEGGNETASSLKDVCSYATITSEDDYKPVVHKQNTSCILETPYNLCMSPAYSDFTLYGGLLKYDEDYFLKRINASIIWEGFDGSIFDGDINHWLLHSKIHDSFCALKDAFLPVGRVYCIQSKTNRSILINLTKCKYNEFGCSNGACVPKSSRCNSIVECSDESDEENCKTIEKKAGYINSRIPPPLDNESVFKLIYFIWVNNVADIKSDDGIAVVDIAITFLWRDPRLTIWNPAPNEMVNCDDIWIPVMAMSNGYPSGFKISFTQYISSCSVASDYSDLNYTKELSFKDPYMGKHC